MSFDASPGHQDLSSLEREALEEIRALIRIETVNTGVAATIGDGEARAARYVQARLEEVGYQTHYVEPASGRGSVVARLPGWDPAAGALVVHAHLDVVPADALEWSHPPFGAEIHDGLLFGRGAVDMKNFAGTLLAIARAWRRGGVIPRRDLVFAFFADEESGGVWGARWLVDNRPELFAGASEALGEVGGFSVPLAGGRRAYPVATAEKGVTVATLVATGRGGHGSRPASDNAVVRVARAVAGVAAHQFEIVRTPALNASLEVFSANSHPGNSVADADIDEYVAGLGVVGPLISAGLRDTATPTVLVAGDKTNVIPARAEARLDVRVPPGRFETLRSELGSIVGPEITVEWGDLIAPIESSIETPLLHVLQDAITYEDASGVVVPYLLPASTDNKHLARIGIAGYGFVPLRVPDDFDVFARFHVADECIPVVSLTFCVRVMDRVLRNA